MIYFYGSVDGRLIKLGHTDRLRQRHKTHTSGDAFGQGGKMELLALLRGTRADETRLKSYFDSARAPGPKTEVFHAAALIPYVTWLRDQYFVSTTFEEFYTEAGQTVIDSQVWLPAPEKISDRRSGGLFANVTRWSFLPNRQRTADDWYTPEPLVDVIRAALGGVIDLDPASHVVANALIKARQIYTHAQDGLLHPWAGRVYLNPPFDQWDQWAQRADDEWARGDVTDLVMLGFTRTMTAQYFSQTIGLSDALAILKGRYAFWGRETDAEAPPDGVFLMYRGQAVERFLLACRLSASWIGRRA